MEKARYLWWVYRAFLCMNIPLAARGRFVAYRRAWPGAPFSTPTRNKGTRIESGGAALKVQPQIQAKRPKLFSVSDLRNRLTRQY